MASPALQSDFDTPEGFSAVACHLCGADDAETVTVVPKDYEYEGILDDGLTHRRFRIVRCRGCGLVYLNPRPSLEAVLPYYPDEYCCFAQFPPKNAIMKAIYRVMAVLKTRRLLPRLPDDGVVLDYGCGTGHWLVALHERAKPGQRFIGIDASERAVKQLEGTGVEGHVGDDALLGTAVPAGSVDLILLDHVIEHVPEPRDTLARLASVLKPGGEIHGVTPNVDAWDARLFGPKWVGWHVPRHFFLFDHESFTRLAEDAGLEVVSLRSDPEGASHWAVSMHTWLADRMGFVPSPERWRLPIYPLMLLAAIAVAAPQLVFSKTSVMSFVLRKPASKSTG